MVDPSTVAVSPEQGAPKPNGVVQRVAAIQARQRAEREKRKAKKRITVTRGGRDVTAASRASVKSFGQLSISQKIALQNIRREEERQKRLGKTGVIQKTAGGRVITPAERRFRLGTFDAPIEVPKPETKPKPITTEPKKDVKFGTVQERFAATLLDIEEQKKLAETQQKELDKQRRDILTADIGTKFTLTEDGKKKEIGKAEALKLLEESKESTKKFIESLTQRTSLIETEKGKQLQASKIAKDFEESSLAKKIGITAGTFIGGKEGFSILREIGKGIDLKKTTPFTPPILIPKVSDITKGIKGVVIESEKKRITTGDLDFSGALSEAIKSPPAVLLEGIVGGKVIGTLSATQKAVSPIIRGGKAAAIATETALATGGAAIVLQEAAQIKRLESQGKKDEAIDRLLSTGTAFAGFISGAKTAKSLLPAKEKIIIPVITDISPEVKFRTEIGKDAIKKDITTRRIEDSAIMRDIIKDAQRKGRDVEVFKSGQDIKIKIRQDRAGKAFSEFIAKKDLPIFTEAKFKATLEFGGKGITAKKGVTKSEIAAKADIQKRTFEKELKSINKDFKAEFKTGKELAGISEKGFPEGKIIRIKARRDLGKLELGTEQTRRIDLFFDKIEAKTKKITKIKKSPDVKGFAGKKSAFLKAAEKDKFTLESIITEKGKPFEKLLGKAEPFKFKSAAEILAPPKKKGITITEVIKKVKKKKKINIIERPTSQRIVPRRVPSVVIDIEPVIFGGFKVGAIPTVTGIEKQNIKQQLRQEIKSGLKPIIKTKAALKTKPEIKVGLKSKIIQDQPIINLEKLSQPQKFKFALVPTLKTKQSFAQVIRQQIRPTPKRITVSTPTRRPPPFTGFIKLPKATPKLRQIRVSKPIRGFKVSFKIGKKFVPSRQDPFRTRQGALRFGGIASLRSRAITGFKIKLKKSNKLTVLKKKRKVPKFRKIRKAFIKRGGAFIER